MTGIKTTGINTSLPYTITKEVSAKIMAKSNSKEIAKFLETGLKGKGKDNYVMQVKDGNKYFVVEPYNDGGTQKYGIITIDSKTNEILDISIKGNVPLNDRAYVVPKMDEQKLLTTKLENPDGTAIVYDIDNIDYDWDVSDRGEGSLNVKPGARHMDKGGFVYSKNPLRVKDFRKEIPFARLAKTFNIPTSLEKTYELKLNNKSNELSVLRWVAAKSGMTIEQVLDKLGYDSIVKTDNSVTFFKYGNVLRRGVEYKHGKRSENYSDLIKRNVSENTRKELAKYVGKNGRELKTSEESFDYSRLIRETLSYDVQDILYDGETYAVKIVDPQQYTPDMLRIVSTGKKIGVRTRFALRLQEADYDQALSSVSAYWQAGGKDILVFIDGGRRGTLEQTATHELGHAIFDKLHGWNLLDVEGWVSWLKRYSPEEFEENYEMYASIWGKAYDRTIEEFEQKIIEEMFVDTFAGLLEWEDKTFQNTLIANMKDLYTKGSKWANKQYYSMLAEEEAKDYYSTYEDRIEPEFKETSIGLAVTYDESITNETFDRQIAKYKPKVETRLNQIAKAFGVTFEVGEAIGGWTFTDNSNKVVIAGEPSFPVTIKGYKSIEDVKLIASILADTAYEVQNSVGVVEYDKNGGDIEDTFALTKVDDGLNEIIKSAKLEGYTLHKNDKKLVVIGADDDTIEILLDELENGGYLDGKYQTTKCNTNWLGLKERANLYQTWLNKNGVGQEKGLVYRYVTKASKINKYVVDHLDSEGHRVEGTENRASKIFDLLKERTGNRPTNREIIKDSANLKHEKVYNLKTANQIVDNALINMLNKWDNAVKITIPNGKSKLKDFTFEELNLYKDRDKAIDNIVSEIESAVVTFDNGVNGHQKVSLKELGMTEDLTKAIRGLVAHKGDLSDKSKWVQKYISTLHRYAGYVHERALMTSEYVTAVKAQKTLDKIFEDTRTIKIGGDTIANEITLYKQLTSNLLLSKSSKNVSPSTFTKLVNNFNNYTAENYAGYFDVTLKDLVDELSLSFENGKFPDREPRLSEMQLFNAIRAKIIARCRTLTSEKHKLKIKNNEEGTLLASISLPSVEPKHYGTVKNILDSAVSFPVKIRSLLGDEHPFVKLFTDNYLKVSANAISKTNEFRTYNFEELAKEAGYPKRGALIKDLKKKNIEINDRNGKVYKKTIDDVIGAYWVYKTAKDQLLATGLTSYNSKNKTDVDFKIDDELYQKMFNKLPESARKWADLVFDKYFNGMDYEYKMSIIKEFFGDLNFLSARKGTYAPTSRVGQVNMGVGATSQYDAGYLSTMLKGFLKERVKNKNHFRWQSASDMLERNMQQVASWGEKSQWVDDVRTALNTTIPGVGNHTLEYYLDKHVPEWKDVWSPYMSKIVIGKQILEKKHGFLEFLGNVGQVATLGGNIGSILRQTLSDFSWTFDNRVSWKMWISTLPQAVSNFFKMGSIKKELMENNGYFIERFNEGDVIKAIMNGKLPFKISQFVLKPMEWLDSVVVSTHGYALAKRIVNEGIKKGTYTFAKGSSEYKKEVAHVLQGMTLISQSNADPMFMSRLRSGDTGWINREVFGRFASDNQNKYQALSQITREKVNSDKRRKAYEDASKDDKYSSEQREAFKKASEQEAKNFKKNYGKKIANFVVSMVLNGLGAYAITHFVRKIKGKEEWNEFDKPEIALRDVFLESTVNWVPYIGTIANAIENNSDVSVFTVEKLNNLVDTVKLVEQAFVKGDEKSIKRAIWSLIANGLELTGVPANNLYQLFMGIWYQFDKDGSLSAQSWVKGYNSSFMKSQYTSAINNGNTSRAKAQLGAWSSMYSTNITDEATLDELVRLSEVGYNVTPSANMTAYTNNNGDRISFTSTQANAFKTEYAKSNKVVSELLKIEGYKKQDDKSKASMISKIYSAYRESAQAKALGIAPNSKLAQLIYFTGGDIDMAKYILSAQELASVKEDKNHTRKENAVSEINKLKNFTKNEKLLLAYLSGYSVNENNKTQMLRFLISNGFPSKDAKAFLGIK